MSLASRALPALLTLLLGLALPARANDGIDRYRGAEPCPLFLAAAPAPGSPAYYRVLAADAPGGADGSAAARWMRGHAQDAVLVSLWRVHEAMGPTTYAAALFDASAENGDTPVDWTAEGGPRGRHPGGSHDGGLNVDVGYYLTSLEGKRFTPDHAACTEHFADGADAFRCTGPPDRLDTNRQALFLVELFKLHQQLFLGELVREVGVDARVREVVLERVASWQREGLHGVSAPLVEDLRARLTHDPFEGWAHHHHHHLHVRVADLDPAGPRLLALRALREMAVAAAEAGREREPNLVVARLGSLRLERFVDAHVLHPTPSLERVLWSADGSSWVEGVKEERFHGVVPLGPAAQSPDRATGVLVYVQLRHRDGREQIETRELEAPPQPTALAVAVHPEAIAARVTRSPQGARLEVAWPPAFDALITKVGYQAQGAARPRAFPEGARSLELKPNEPASGDLVLTLSGRMLVRVPVR